MVKEKEKIKCENCGSINNYIDMNGGEIVCQDCGMVSNKLVFWKNEIYEK